MKKSAACKAIYVILVSSFLTAAAPVLAGQLSAKTGDCRGAVDSENDFKQNQSGVPGLTFTNGKKLQIEAFKAHDRVSEVELQEHLAIVRDVILRLGSKFQLMEDLTVRPSPEGLTGSFAYFRIMTGPVRVGTEKLPFAMLSVADSATMMIHELGHVQFDHRFYSDRRLNYKIPNYFNILRGREEYDFLNASVSNYNRSPEFKAKLTEAGDKWIQAQNDFERNTNRRPGDGAEGDTYNGAHSAAIAFHSRFLSFTEMYANLVARLFETSPGASDRLLDYTAKASAYLANEDLSDWSGTRRFAKVPESAIAKAISNTRLEKGFSEFIEPDAWQASLLNLAKTGSFKDQFGGDAHFETTQHFRELVLAPFRGWLGRDVLPQVRNDQDRLRVLEVTYEAIIATFTRMDSLSYISISEVAELNKILLREFRARWDKPNFRD